MSIIQGSRPTNSIEDISIGQGKGKFNFIESMAGIEIMLPRLLEDHGAPAGERHRQGQLEVIEKY